MASMPAFVPAPDAPGRIGLADVPEPEPGPDEALVIVEAYSVNRGELFLLEAPRDAEDRGHRVVGRQPPHEARPVVARPAHDHEPHAC